MQNGAPKEKLVMGMPLYGQSFTLSSASNNGLNAPTSAPGLAGPFTGQGGLLAYNEICYKVKNEGWTVVGPTSQMGPYAYKDKQWVSYDDPATIRKKVITSYVTISILNRNINMQLHFMLSMTKYLFVIYSLSTLRA